MNEQPCSVHSTIATAILSSYRVLDLLRNFSFQRPLNEQELQEAAYLTFQPWAARFPDHVFQSSWQYLVKHRDKSRPKPKASLWTSIALQAIAEEFIEPRHGELKIKLEKFGSWQQSVLSRISGLPIQAAAMALWINKAYLAYNTDLALGDDRFGDNREQTQRVSPLLSPYDAMVEDYIESEGLHETHLHLNGSTHAELCWLRALLDPVAETKNFDSYWQNTSNPEAFKIWELAHAVNPKLNPSELYRQLRTAARLRQWLIAAATGRIDINTELPLNYEQLMEGDALLAPESGEWTLKLSKQSSIADELKWMTKLLLYLEDQPSVILDRMFHCYLVLQNLYYRLLVQSEEQFGFDQFQKFTFTGLREPAEQDYFQRFLYMHGGHVSFSRTGNLEGRFAPKSSLQDSCKLLKSILGGYWCYLRGDTLNSRQASKSMSNMNDLLKKLEDHFRQIKSFERKHHRLALVAHFIKQPWSAEPWHKAGHYRHYDLRKSIESKANVLLQTLRCWPGLSKWLRGIDAAANELHAPPEVFASCFRVCQQAGLTRRSYHVGEDFPHLLSGIRHMLDALELLDLRDGDRIGHGTAMGISPRIWIERMPGQLLVKKGEWMLDLLAVWRLLRRLPDATAHVYRVECDLAKFASQIFGKDVSCIALEQAMQFRGLNLRYLMASQEDSWRWEWASFSDLWRSEAKRVHEAKDKNRADLDLLWIWLSDDKIWELSEELVKVDAAYFDAETFIRIQQQLMTEVRDRKVVVETLPSSNVRISQYHNFREHHSLRWMRVPGFMEEGDPEIMVSLGSDDPGIFAGDLNGEFYQLYAALRNEGFGDKTALDYLAPINERGRQYRFHHPSLR